MLYREYITAFLYNKSKRLLCKEMQHNMNNIRLDPDQIYTGKTFRKDGILSIENKYILDADQDASGRKTAVTYIESPLW